ncbi:MAG: amino acid ABC transporter substrate-binding protein [Proteobacteria bacterium]|jgi:ABC-type amino acid transport substrate-binding protein|nr:amino acid ABC transporter substrate-binding protein [Methylibium sp.]MBY0367739.1 amino acid ABC transporter substrate-binding protein [Burkholderiaceae bacterium]MCH8855772.1 amino acid ABC transporter substrate-binding protein [Pseudomonadota bacterium]|mmetsp:Transcript_21620/g.51383  ORF Transcript_21620/g.51383 Transcript_21620/m.51383 type:complete len:295 (+) Transcript_21620:2755-3639(+)
MLMKTLLPLLLALGLTTTASAGPVLDRIKTSGRIVIAHREASVPFSYLLPDGRPVGYAVDLCLKVAEAVRQRLKMPSLNPQFMLVTPANRIQAVVDGKADLECGSTTNNAERREKVAFTVPHYITGARYLVRANSGITDLAQFEGRTLVSTKGTTPLKSITQANSERALHIKIVEAPDNAKAMDMLAAGQVDGFVLDDVQLYGIVSARPDADRFEVVGKLLTIEALAIVLPKNDPEFKAIVDDEMKRLITSREAHAVYERWFLKPIPPKNTSLKLPMNYLLKDFWKYPSDQVPY